MRFVLLLMVFVLVAGAAMANAADEFLSVFDIPDGAVFIGSESCADCHEDEDAAYAHSPHGALLALGGLGTVATGCEACHGPASLHVAADGDDFIVGVELLASLDEAQEVAMCTRCHQSHAGNWPGSPHDGSGIGCSSCHADQVHFSVEALPVTDYRNRAEFCLQCHPEQEAAFRLPFHHQVLEGRLDCEDCHDPHSGFDQTTWNGLNDVCLDCHDEVAGPFVYEHDGVQSEDCLICHRPHGSHHDKLLVQEGNGLCMQCHFEEGFNSGDGFGIGDQGHAGILQGENRCYDCHIDVHGSNVNPTFRN